MINLEKAKKALEASEQKANELKVKVTTTVVDEHGTVIAVNRMDGAIPISPEFAYAKAYTSANLGSSTEGLSHYAGEGKPYFDFTALKGGIMTAIAGGVPIIIEGKIIGAVGVGGSMDVSNDVKCAEEAKKILEG